MKWLAHLMRACVGPECRWCARMQCKFCGDFLRLPSAVHSWNGQKWECRAILVSRHKL